MNSRRHFLTGLIGAGAGLMLARKATAQSVAYTYDVHGRLVGVSRSGAQTSYAYDAANNRMQRGSGPPGPPPPPAPLTAALDRTEWYGSPSYPDPPIYVIVGGGVGPYTYAWRRVSGSNRVWVMNPSSGSVTFGGNPEEFYGFTASFVCKVTDAVGTQIDSNSVSATFSPDF